MLCYSPGTNSKQDHHTKTKRCDLCDLVWRMRLCAWGNEAC